MRIAPPTLALAGLLILVPLASADPGPEYTCQFGYNPTAIANVCYDATNPGEVPAGTVGTSTLEICPIGNICAPVPLPTYDPEGSTPITEPGGVYVEVLGVPMEVTYDAMVDYVHEEVVDFIVEETVHQTVTDCETNEPRPVSSACGALNDSLFG